MKFVRIDTQFRLGDGRLRVLLSALLGVVGFAGAAVGQEPAVDLTEVVAVPIVATSEANPTPIPIPIPPLPDGDMGFDGAVESAASPTADLFYSDVDPDVVQFETDGGRGGRFEKFGVRVGLETEVAYEDNIFYSAPGGEESDVVFRIRPILFLDFGDAREREAGFISLGYQPTATLFVDFDSENSFDHDVSLAVGQRGAKLSTTVEAAYRTLSDASVDIGERTDRQVIDASVLMEYALTAKVGLRADAAYVREDYDQFSDFDEWRANLYATYELGPKTVVGIGYGYGELRPEDDGDQQYHRALARADWQASEKLGLAVWGGADFRSGLPGGSDTTFVYGLELAAALREGTRITLGLDRDLGASALEGTETYTLTAYRVGIEQRIGTRFSLAVDAGFEDYSYVGTPSDDGELEDRDDQGLFVRPSLRYQLREEFSAELFYTYRENDSSRDSLDFENNQVGASMRLEF